MNAGRSKFEHEARRRNLSYDLSVKIQPITLFVELTFDIRNTLFSAVGVSCQENAKDRKKALHVSAVNFRLKRARQTAD